MAITKDKKKQILEKLQTVVKRPSSVFVHFSKMSVGDANSARKALRSQGVSFYVAKKTLIKRAFAEMSLKGEMPDLVGEIGVAFSDDQMAPSRVVKGFGKTIDGVFEIVGGVFEGEYKNSLIMNEIASIPDRKTLIAQFVNVINSPIQGLAVSLSKIAEKKA